MFAILYEYKYNPDRLGDFLAAYKPDGEWAKLFADKPGFIETHLVRIVGSGTYITVDMWESEAAYESFLATHAEEYLALDLACADLREEVGEGKRYEVTHKNAPSQHGR